MGVELPIGNNWSLGVDYYYPWIWPKKDNKNCFELIFVSAEARYWFGKRNATDDEKRMNRLTGHSIGVYGAWGYYDVERNYKGHQGHAWSAGIDYLYSLPVAKGKLRIEFELAVGAIWSTAKPYNVYEAGGTLYPVQDKLKKVRYFGPTKASISLVIPINRSVKRLAAPQL